MRLLHIRQNNIKVIVSDYGSALRNLCLSSGIPCSCVQGETGEDSQIHLWDRVCVDGKWYYCDPAWNDGGNDEYPFLFSEKLWKGRTEETDPMRIWSNRDM